MEEVTKTFILLIESFEGQRLIVLQACSEEQILPNFQKILWPIDCVHNAIFTATL